MGMQDECLANSRWAYAEHSRYIRLVWVIRRMRAASIRYTFAKMFAKYLLKAFTETRYIR